MKVSCASIKASALAVELLVLFLRGAVIAVGVLLMMAALLGLADMHNAKFHVRALVALMVFGATWSFVAHYTPRLRALFRTFTFYSNADGVFLRDGGFVPWALIDKVYVSKTYVVFFARASEYDVSTQLWSDEAERVGALLKQLRDAKVTLHISN